MLGLLGPPWSLIRSCVQVAQHLASTYGAKAYDVAKMAQVTGQRWPIVGKRLVSEFPYIEAEVRFSTRRKSCCCWSLAHLSSSQVLYAIKEYACTAIDIIARRTRLGFLNVQAADEALPRIVEIMGKELDWSQERRTVEEPDQEPAGSHSPGVRRREERGGKRRRRRKRRRKRKDEGGGKDDEDKT